MLLSKSSQKQMNYSAIAKIGEPILRQKARLVGKIDDPNIIELIDRLVDAALANQGVGIAAPQISQPYRLFVVASHKNERYPHAPTMTPTPMINPRIVARGQTIIKDWEGCLSVPNTRGLVPRYQQITVEYTTRAGEVKQDVLTDFVARIFQHELDHLDGILFTDRISNSEDLYTEAEYRQLIGLNRTQ